MHMISAKNMLIENDIQPTTPRVVILEYLLKSHEHPSCNDIYRDLSKTYPIMNKATIYNTINLFVKKSMLSPIYLNDECRYEIKQDDHGHFECIECGNIIDFPFDYSNFSDLEGFKIKEKKVSFRGTCPDCLGQKKEE